MNYWCTNRLSKDFQQMKWKEKENCISRHSHLVDILAEKEVQKKKKHSYFTNNKSRFSQYRHTTKKIEVRPCYYSNNKKLIIVKNTKFLKIIQKFFYNFAT